MYKLVITEKPSVAQAVARALGVKGRKDGYLEGKGYLISWCIGHLVELSPPDAYDEKYQKWRKEDLPILPDSWKYQISERTKKQFQILRSLMEREDVEALINACDSGREGELIFRHVYYQAGCEKPFERLWISSMEDQAIRDGFLNLKDGKEYDALYAAALCREQADWLVGMNGTRYFSTIYGQVLNVGRVMTPTLSMIQEREEEIRDFKPETFYKIGITVAGVQAESERILEKEQAEASLHKIEKESAARVQSLTRKEKHEKAPELYDLTSLQRDANRSLGFTAKQTLEYAQSLYEAKLITYPRTDSRYLTEDMEEKIIGLEEMLEEKFGISQDPFVNAGQVMNAKKVSDHHAIIPTEELREMDYATIPAGERKVLDLIAARFLAAIREDAVYQEIEVVIQAADMEFTSKSKLLMNKGWREVQEWILQKEKKTETESRTEFFENMMEGESYPIRDPKLEIGKTSAKKHFTEDSLLSSMEKAGAKETPEEAERKGIGTPATRADIIEKLVKIGVLERKGDQKSKALFPTKKGAAMIEVMPEILKSPELTANWEQRLLDVEHGDLSPEEFLQGIQEMITSMMEGYEIAEEAEIMSRPKKESMGSCPCCGKNVVEGTKGYYCEDRECHFILWKENRFFESIGKKLTKEIVKSLLKDGQVLLKGCTSKKSGNFFDATLKLSIDDQQKAVFNLEFAKREKTWKGKKG